MVTICCNFNNLGRLRGICLGGDRNIGGDTFVGSGSYFGLGRIVLGIFHEVNFLV